MRPSPALARLGLALLVSVLAGVLVAALALPVVGGTALAAKSQADEFLDLPAELTAEQPPTRTRILAADGSLLATLYLENRVNVPLSSVPEHVREAVIAIEDARFYEHNGVDTKGTLRAAIRNSRAGGVQQGGSTLTQQYVKNALLASARDKAGQEAARAQSLERKLQEARYALAIERKLSKDEILSRYLNIAYFGNGAYGIGAAAQHYFGVPVQKLTLAQGAVLAGVVQNPSRFDLKDAERRPAVVARRATVLQRMHSLGFIDEATRYNASRAPIKLNIKTVGSGCEDKAVGSAAFFCDYVRRELEGTDVGKALGQTREERQAKLLGGGLVIKTSLDRDVQRAAQEGVDERVPQDDASGARAVADVVEPGTGEIKAMAVNIPYGEGKGQSKVNFAIGGSFGFQAGSTFKAFVLATALKQGIPLSLTLYSPAEYESEEFINYVDGRKIPYKVKNSEDSEDGTFDLLEATHLSVNTYYVQLLERTKVEEPATLAESLGVRRVRNPEGKLNAPLDRGANFVLGGSEVSPLAMAGAYAAFAANGKYCRPQAVLSITDSRGKPVEVPKPQCKQVMEPEIAGTVNQVLRGVVDGPNPKTGKAASIGRPVAGKTGTTNESRAAWFIGYTPQLSTAVWVGTPDPETGAPTSMRRATIGGRYYRQVYGGTIPAAIFRITMREAMRDKPVRDFDDVELPEAAEGELVEVPDLRGLSVEEARRKLSEAGFGVSVGDTVPASYVPRGTVAYSAPRRNTQARQGETVTIFIAGRTARGASSSDGSSTTRRRATAEPAVRRSDPAPAQTVQAQPASQPAREPADEPSGRPKGKPSKPARG